MGGHARAASCFETHRFAMLLSMRRIESEPLKQKKGRPFGRRFHIRNVRDAAYCTSTSCRSPDERSDIRGSHPAYRFAHAGYSLR
jgi:hypothetical protein